MPSHTASTFDVRCPQSLFKSLINSVKPTQAALQNFFTANQDTVTQKVTDLEQSWRGNILDYAFKTMGMKVSGTLDVQPDAVKVVTQIPLAAMFFKGAIETQLRDNLTKVLQS